MWMNLIYIGAGILLGLIAVYIQVKRIDKKNVSSIRRKEG